MMAQQPCNPFSRGKQEASQYPQQARLRQTIRSRTCCVGPFLAPTALCPDDLRGPPIVIGIMIGSPGRSSGQSAVWAGRGLRSRCACSEQPHAATQASDEQMGVSCNAAGAHARPPHLSLAWVAA